MKNLRKLYLHNSIFRFMISYAGVLLIPLLVCLLSYQFTFGIVKEEITQNNLSMLKRSKNLIDGQIQTISSLMMQVSDNNKIINFTDEDLMQSNKFYTEASSVIDEIGYIFKYSNTNILDDLYLYIDKTDYIVTRYDLYKSSLYYKMVLKEVEPYNEWISDLTNEERLQRYITTDDKIKLIQRLPLGINKKGKGTIVCNINKNNIKNYFTDIEVEDGANLFIQDKEGNVLFQLSDQYNIPELEYKKGEEVFTQEIEGVENTIFRLECKETGWVYTLVVPEHVIMHKLATLKCTIAGLFLLATLIGVVISYYMAKKSGKPIEEVKKKLIELKEDIDIQIDEIASTSSLSGTLTAIMSQRQMLSQEIEQQKPYLETVLFQKLIRGEFISSKELQYICQRTQIRLDAEAYWVLNCRFFGNNDMFNLDEQTIEDVNLLKILLKEIIQTVIPEKMYFYDLDQLTTTIILPKVNMNTESIKESIHTIDKQMQNEYEVVPYWGISSECRDLSQLWRAFEESKSALKSGIQKGKENLIEYSKMEINETTYYYSQVLEKQVITYIKEEDTENIRKLWEMVYQENFENRTLSQDTIAKLYTEIKGTIFKITQDVDKEFKIDDIEKDMLIKNKEDIKRCFEYIIELCTHISSAYGQEKKSQQNKLIHRIMNYINENYSDASLGLGMIATNFNISEGYVSSLFKEQSGVNFTEYVETQRINKACELLKTTDININDISEQVGYNSVQSFRRAFKRIHGFSPSELRKNKG